jgi:hypothetical protein
MTPDVGLTYRLDVRAWRWLERPSRIALVVVWSIFGLFVLSNISEDVRGDSFFVGFIRGDIILAALLTAGVIAVDLVLKAAKGPKNY